MTQQMTVRRLDFGFTPDMERVFVKNDPQMSFMFLGAWMMLPYLEPYLIRSMRDALPKITDASLKDDLKRFCAQEGEHFKQHAKANDLIRALNPAYEALRPLEAELDAEFKRFSKEKPLKFNLAYAEGFESMTSAMSRVQLEVGLYDRTDSPLAHLGKWHIMEELEHRSVAFDVYEHIFGSWSYRVRTALWAQGHYFGWVKKLAKVITDAEPALIARYQTSEIVAERKAFNRRYLMKGLPSVLKTYLPNYDPSKSAMPPQYAAAQAQYSNLAMSVA